LGPSNLTKESEIKVDVSEKILDEKTQAPRKPGSLDIIPSQNTIEDDVLFPKVVYILGN